MMGDYKNKSRLMLNKQPVQIFIIQSIDVLLAIALLVFLLGNENPLLMLVTRKKEDPVKMSPYLGRFHHDILGDASLVLHEDNTLWIDFGEYESSIRPLILEENQYILFESTFIGKTIQMNMNPDRTPTMKWTGEEGSYEFEATGR